MSTGHVTFDKRTLFSVKDVGRLEGQTCPQMSLRVGLGHFWENWELGNGKWEVGNGKWEVGHGTWDITVNISTVDSQLINICYRKIATRSQVSTGVIEKLRTGVDIFAALCYAVPSSVTRL